MVAEDVETDADAAAGAAGAAGAAAAGAAATGAAAAAGAAGIEAGAPVPMRLQVWRKKMLLSYAPCTMLCALLLKSRKIFLSGGVQSAAETVKMRIKNLVISGGSVRSIAVIGCLQYLFQECGGQDALDGIVNIVGTSAGAIIALMLTVGFKPMDMENAMKNMLLVKEYHKLNFDDLLELRVFDSFGLDSGETIIAFVRDILAAKGIAPDATFLDLAKRTGKNLVVCAANLTKQRSDYICVDTFPDMPVATAVRMSASLPILLAPVKWKGDLYVDGALYESLPVGYIASKFHDSLRDTLAIRTCAGRGGTDGGGTDGGTDDNIVSYFNSIIWSLLTKANEASYLGALASSASAASKITIFDVEEDVLSADGNLFGFDISNLNFEVDADSVDRAIRRGFDAFKHFVDEGFSST